MKNYSIALLPEDSQPFIDYAQSNFRDLTAADSQSDNVENSTNISYLLGEKSFPHISLCQFQCKQDQLAPVIEAFQIWSNNFTVQPNLHGFAYTGLTGKFYPKIAAEIIVERTKNLVSLHTNAIHFIHNFQLSISMSAFDNMTQTCYRPHLTLAVFSPPRMNIK